MGKRVLLAGADLLLRSKLAGVVDAAGGEITREEAQCDLAVVAIEAPGAQDRVKEMIARGVAVVAFGPHVRADLLRAAREAGATAVPNSQIEHTLADLLR